MDKDVSFWSKTLNFNASINQFKNCKKKTTAKEIKRDEKEVWFKTCTKELLEASISIHK